MLKDLGVVVLFAALVLGLLIIPPLVVKNMLETESYVGTDITLKTEQGWNLEIISDGNHTLEIESKDYFLLLGENSFASANPKARPVVFGSYYFHYTEAFEGTQNWVVEIAEDIEVRVVSETETRVELKPTRELARQKLFPVYLTGLGFFWLGVLGLTQIIK